MSKNKGGLSIFYKLLFVLLSVFLIISGTLTVIFYTFSKESIEDHTKERLLQQMEAIDYHFTGSIKEQLTRELQVLASTPSIDDYMISSELNRVLNVRTVERLFLKTIHHIQSYHTISFVDYSGREKISVDRNGRRRDYRSWATGDLFRRIETGPPGNIQFEGPYQNAAGDYLFSLGIAKADMDIGRFGGAVIVEYNLNKFFRYLDEIRIFQENPIWILAPDGKVLKKPKSRRAYFDPTVHVSPGFHDTPLFMALPKGLVIHQDLSFPPEPDSLFLSVLISVPASLLLEDIRSTMRFFTFVSAFSLIAIVLVVFSLARYFSRPIRKLAQAVANVSMGDMSAQVQLHTSGELKTLVTSFNTMALELGRTMVSKKYVDSILQSMTESLVVVSSDMVIQSANPATLSLLGYENDELVGRPFKELIDKDAETLFSSTSSMFNTISGKELVYLTKEGLSVPVLFSASPLLDDQEQIQGIVFVAQDITARQKTDQELSRHRDHLEMMVQERTTELKELNAALQKAHDELEHRVEERTLQLKKTNDQLLHAEKLSAVGKLSASIAHEINNPLYGIQSVLEGIQRNTSLNEREVNLIDLALNECDRVKNLIKDLQDFNRPTSGVKRFINIHKVINDMISLCEKKLKGAHVTIREEFATNLPNVPVVSDQIKQVLLNLLTNAKDSMKDSGGTVTITTERLDTQIAIHIKDTGSGIKPEDLDYIFEPFFTTKAAVKGVGLGLSVSYGIIKNHGGDIRAESEPGKGTTFSVILPITTEA